MSKFKWVFKKGRETNSATVNYATKVEEYLDVRTIQEVVQEFAKLYVKKNYQELVKQIDEKALVQELSIRIAQEVLEGMYRR